MKITLLLFSLLIPAIGFAQIDVWHLEEGSGPIVRARDARRIADIARLMKHHLVAGIDERWQSILPAFAESLTVGL